MTLCQKIREYLDQTDSLTVSKLHVQRVIQRVRAAIVGVREGAQLSADESPAVLQPTHQLTHLTAKYPWPEIRRPNPTQ